MANTRISSLTAGSAIAGTDLFPDVQTVGVGPVKVTATQLATFFWNAPTLVTPNIGVATGTSLALTGSLTSGTQQTAQGSVILSNTAAGAFATTIKSSNSASVAWTLTLPTTAGTGGYILTTDGAGVTSWTSNATAVTLTVNSTPTSGGAAGQIMFDDGTKLQESANLSWNNTNRLMTLTGLGTGAGATSTGLTVSGGSFGLSGNISASAWTTNGIRYRNVAATLTDTSSTGTVATAYTDLFGGNTIAASNSTTFTDYYTIFVSQPTAGTNVTFTNRWAFGTNGNTKTTGNSVVTGYVQAPQIYSVPTALTSGAAIAWDANVSSVASLTLNQVGATLTMSNLIAGGTYLLIITQGAGGNKTITTWTNFKWVGGAIPTLSSSAGAIDVITAYSDGTNLYASAQIGFA